MNPRKVVQTVKQCPCMWGIRIPNKTLDDYTSIYHIVNNLLTHRSRSSRRSSKVEGDPGGGVHICSSIDARISLTVLGYLGIVSSRLIRSSSNSRALTSRCISEINSLIVMSPM